MMPVLAPRPEDGTQSALTVAISTFNVPSLPRHGQVGLHEFRNYLVWEDLRCIKD